MASVANDPNSHWITSTYPCTAVTVRPPTPLKSRASTGVKLCPSVPTTDERKSTNRRQLVSCGKAAATPVLPPVVPPKLSFAVIWLPFEPRSLNQMLKATSWVVGSYQASENCPA